MTKLRVYSTVAGELPLLVGRREPMCFVPLEQARELEAEIARLRKRGIEMYKHIANMGKEPCPTSATKEAV